jgi:iron-sulfur cluster insertion protein
MTETMTESLSLTPAAAKRIRLIADKENNPALMLRLAVSGGGCSGFSYGFSLDANFNNAEDILIERDGSRLVVDKVSLDLLKGSEVDFAESLSEAGFVIRNPNAKSSCGCGTSFST